MIVCIWNTPRGVFRKVNDLPAHTQSTLFHSHSGSFTSLLSLWAGLNRAFALLLFLLWHIKRADDESLCERKLKKLGNSSLRAGYPVESKTLPSNASITTAIRQEFYLCFSQGRVKEQTLRCFDETTCLQWRHGGLIIKLSGRLDDCCTQLQALCYHHHHLFWSSAYENT